MIRKQDHNLFFVSCNSSYLVKEFFRSFFHSSRVGTVQVAQSVKFRQWNDFRSATRTRWYVLYFPAISEVETNVVCSHSLKKWGEFGIEIRSVKVETSWREKLSKLWWDIPVGEKSSIKSFHQKSPQSLCFPRRSTYFQNRIWEVRQLPFKPHSVILGISTSPHWCVNPSTIW